jgi:hypothetical protein
MCDDLSLGSSLTPPSLHTHALLPLRFIAYSSSPFEHRPVSPQKVAEGIILDLELLRSLGASDWVS